MSNAQPLESNSVCATCGGHAIPPKSLCCGASVVTPTEYASFCVPGRPQEAPQGNRKQKIERAVNRSVRKQDYRNGIAPVMAAKSYAPSAGRDLAAPLYGTQDADEPTIGPGKIADPIRALAFLLAGNAVLTIRSQKTGTRYTYKVTRAKDNPDFQRQPYANQPVWFVALLSGPDNESDYTYLGMIKDNVFRLTGKSRMKMDSVPVVAFAWMLDKLMKRSFPKDCELWHEGHCGRCNRKLTVPESIATGFGPECAGKVGA